MNTPIKLKDAPENYAIPVNIITLFQLYGYFQIDNEDSRYIMNEEETLLDSVCFSMGVNQEKDVFNLHPFFETTKITYATPNKHPSTYAFLHPLWCVLNYYVKVPNHLTAPLTVTIEMLQGKCFDTPTEPRITMVTLPRLPNRICDWFKWRYEAQTIIEGSGGGRILTDRLFALQNPQASLKVKAMLVKAVALSDGFLTAQFVMPDDVTTNSCGYTIWHFMLDIFETGPIIGHHLEEAQTQLQTIECDGKLQGYVTFLKEFLSLKSRYTYLYKTAALKNLALVTQYPKVDWNAKFKERIRRSTIGDHLNGLAETATASLEQTFMALFVRIQERETSGDSAAPKHDRTPKAGLKEKEKDHAAKKLGGSPGVTDPNKTAVSKLWQEYHSTKDDAAKKSLKTAIDILKPHGKKGGKPPQTGGTDASGNGKRKRRHKNGKNKGPPASKKKKVNEDDAEDIKSQIKVNQQFADLFEQESDHDEQF
jgi:hypothetical protein